MKIDWKSIKTEDKNLLADIQKNEEINDELINFGTAGLRGVMGVGLSKMNEVTVSIATEALAIHLSKNGEENTVAISYDNRSNGFLYAKTAAKILNKHNIEVLMVKDTIIATPILSYIILKEKADAGINITASHNTKEYNGYKVYNHTGGQIGVEEATSISNIMEKIDYHNIAMGDFKPRYLGKSMLNEYVQGVLDTFPAIDDSEEMKIIFSPMHGTGSIVAPIMFEKMSGVNPVYVKEQMVIDDQFSTVESPNPENQESYELVKDYMNKFNGDIGLVTDPDADRVGMIVKTRTGFDFINGNQIAMIVLYEYLTEMKKLNKINQSSFIVTSIVSTNMTDKIAEHFGVKLHKKHVGFKNISDTIEKNEKDNFLFGFEESHGMLLNPYMSMDKDAFQGMAALIWAIKLIQTKGSSVIKSLHNLQSKFGKHTNEQISVKGDEKFKNDLIDKFIEVKTIDGDKVLKVIDFRDDLENKAEVVVLWLESGSTIIIRPSGTEPKIKIYIESVDRKKINISEII